MIANYLKSLKEHREFLLNITNDLTTDQYNFIPPRFNNNIIWNMAHVLLVSESYLYRQADFKSPIHKFDLTLFKKGTKPEQYISTDDIAFIRESLLETTSFFEKNLNQSDLVFDISNSPVSEASLQFILFHEEVHYRTIEKMLKYINL